MLVPEAGGLDTNLSLLCVSLFFPENTSFQPFTLIV
jgi:hypothetical protein